MRFLFGMVRWSVVSAVALFAQQVSPLLAPDAIYDDGKIITVDGRKVFAKAGGGF